MTFNQMKALLKWAEWNSNIRNDKEKDNAYILSEFNKDNEKDLELMKKMKEDLKKSGRYPKTMNS